MVLSNDPLFYHNASKFSGSHPSPFFWSHPSKITSHSLTVDFYIEPSAALWHKDTTTNQVPPIHKPFIPSSNPIPVIILGSQIIMSLWKLLPYKAGWTTFPQANFHSYVSKSFPVESCGITQHHNSKSWGRSFGRSSLFGDSSYCPLLSYEVEMIWMWSGLWGLAMLVPAHSASLLPPLPGIAQKSSASAAQYISDLSMERTPDLQRGSLCFKNCTLLYSIFIVYSMKTKCSPRKWKVCISCSSFACKRMYFHISFPLALWLWASSTIINLWHWLEIQLMDKVLLCC